MSSCRTRGCISARMSVSDDLQNRSDWPKRSRELQKNDDTVVGPLKRKSIWAIPLKWVPSIWESSALQKSTSLKRSQFFVYNLRKIVFIYFQCLCPVFLFDSFCSNQTTGNLQLFAYFLCIIIIIFCPAFQREARFLSAHTHAHTLGQQTCTKLHGCLGVTGRAAAGEKSKKKNTCQYWLTSARPSISLLRSPTHSVTRSLSDAAITNAQSS